MSLGIVVAMLLVASPQKPAGGQVGPSAPVTETSIPINPTDEEWKAFVAKRFAQPAVEPPDPDPFGFSVYRGRRTEPMGTQTLINGARMEVASLLVEDPPHVVARTYHEAFLRMGRVPFTGEVSREPGMRYLSFRPPGSRNLKTVTLVPHGSGTIILASVGNPEELLEQKPRLPDDVPVPPSAEAPTTIQQLESGVSARSAFFRVRGSSPEQVREFYRRELPRHGFAPVESGEADNYERSGLLLSISAVPHKEPGASSVSLVWFEESMTP